MKVKKMTMRMMENIFQNNVIFPFGEKPELHPATLKLRGGVKIRHMRILINKLK